MKAIGWLVFYMIPYKNQRLDLIDRIITYPAKICINMPGIAVRKS